LETNKKFDVNDVNQDFFSYWLSWPICSCCPF